MSANKKMKILNYYISLIILITFTNCNNNVNDNSNTDSNSINYPVINGAGGICDKYASSLRIPAVPQLVTVNTGFQHFCIGGNLIVKFPVIAGKGYTITIDPGILLTSSYNFNSGSVSQKIAYTNGDVVDYGSTISYLDHAQFIATVSGDIQIIYEAFSIFNTYKEQIFSIKINEYNPDLDIIHNADGVWRQYTLNGLGRLSFNVTKGNLYTFSFGSSGYPGSGLDGTPSCIYCQKVFTDTGILKSVFIQHNDNTPVIPQNTSDTPLNYLSVLKGWEHFINFFKANNSLYNSNLIKTYSLDNPVSFVATKTGVVNVELDGSGTISTNMNSPATLTNIALNTWTNLQVDNTLYRSFNLTAGKSYQIIIETNGINGTTSDARIELIYPDGKKIIDQILNPQSNNISFISGQTGLAYYVIHPKTTGTFRTKIIPENTGVIAVNSGWVPYNVNVAQEYTFDVIENNSYTISWDDQSEGSGGYTGDVLVSVKDADGITLVNATDNGYLTPPRFMAKKSGHASVIITPNINGTVGLNIASTTPDPVTPNSGWRVDLVNNRYESKAKVFNVVKGNIYSIQIDNGCTGTTGTYNGILSVDVSYAGLPLNSSYLWIQNSIFNGISCAYQFPKIFLAKYTGLVAIRVYNYNGGSYALKVDTVTPVPYVINNLINGININKSYAYTLNTQDGRMYNITSEFSTLLYPGRFHIDVFYNSGMNIYNTPDSSGIYDRSFLGYTANPALMLITSDYTNTSGMIGLKVSESLPVSINADGNWNNIGKGTNILVSFNAIAGTFYTISHQNSSLSMITYNDWSIVSMVKGMSWVFESDDIIYSGKTGPIFLILDNNTTSYNVDASVKVSVMN